MGLRVHFILVRNITIILSVTIFACIPTSSRKLRNSVENYRKACLLKTNQSFSCTGTVTSTPAIVLTNCAATVELSSWSPMLIPEWTWSFIGNDSILPDDFYVSIEVQLMNIGPNLQKNETLHSECYANNILVQIPSRVQGIDISEVACLAFLGFALTKPKTSYNNPRCNLWHFEALALRFWPWLHHWD
jgi:hypothetical protein